MELTTGLAVQEQEHSGRSYKLSEEKIEGFVDGLEALKQSVYKVLSTERYESPIYSFSYGIAWKDLVGKEEPYIRAEMQRMIREALLMDNRIDEVDDFDFTFTEDACICSFQVSSIYGNFSAGKEAEV